MTRREFCLGAAANCVLLSISTANSLWAGGDKLEGPEKNVDEWMLEWERERIINKDVHGSLDLRRFKDPMYILLDSISWKPKKSTSILSEVIVPKGFVTDFASVPRVFWSLFRPDGNYAYAAVLHDYLYWHQDRPRSSADEIFRAVMEDLKISDFQSTTLFHAVDLFGGAAWESNRQLKSTGEQRILSEFPSNSTVTWEEWKLRPGVFTNNQVSAK